ncbi:NAD(P)H-dependent oxidoreductase [Nocardioides alkalitolerans]|uniref:NAD(P)H-dependent oxidoreductase n=1 Tax=Nocardioides alkalitolerans TaxID=281714 RepID=UPI0004003824|nr:NAD(P)H-dependent oxidoreductase [Nocardioides alkalitolerans]
MSARVVVVVGNPKPRSRTYVAATWLAEQVAGGPPAGVVDLADLGAGLLDWGSAEVAAAVELVSGADVVIVASPTYKGTYTGLLKLFLDRFPTSGLHGVVAVPLLLGAGPAHALAPASLAAVLTEIGADVVTRGLYVIDTQHDDPAAYDAWLTLHRPLIATLVSAGAPR